MEKIRENRGVRLMRTLVFVAMMLAGGLVVNLIFPSEAVRAAEGDEYSQVCKDPSVPAELKKTAGCEENKMLPEVAVNGINWALGVLMVICIVTVITAGQRFITAEGDVGRVKQARIMLLYAVAGIVVASLAFTFVNFVMKRL